MAQTMTKDQQWKTVMQGLALGCLAVGVQEFSTDKLGAEFAFAKAWRGWPRSTEFRSVTARDFYIYASKSRRRIGAFAAWNWRGSLAPYLTIEGWNVGESLEAFAEDEPVSSREWVDLARAFAGHLTT